MLHERDYYIGFQKYLDISIKIMILTGLCIQPLSFAWDWNLTLEISDQTYLKPHMYAYAYVHTENATCKPMWCISIFSQVHALLFWLNFSLSRQVLIYQRNEKYWKSLSEGGLHKRYIFGHSQNSRCIPSSHCQTLSVLFGFVRPFPSFSCITNVFHTFCFSFLMAKHFI